ncbi:unnamed protein product, partial [Aphanomyces euteiches]
MAIQMKFFNTRPSSCLQCKKFGTSYGKKDRLGRGYYCSQACLLANKSIPRHSWSTTSDTSTSDVSDDQMLDEPSSREASFVNYFDDATAAA